MITSGELLNYWHNRNHTIIVDGVSLSEGEVRYACSVLNLLNTFDTDCLSSRQVLLRCKACYPKHVTPGVCANSITILNDTYKEIL